MLNIKLLLKRMFKNTGFKIPLKYHFIFWITYFFLNFLRWGSYFNDYLYSIKSNLVEFPLHIIIVYYNIHYLIPKFILKKKYYKFFIYFILALVALYLVKTGFEYLLVTKNIWPEAEGIQKAYTFNHVVAVIIGEIYVISFVSAIKLFVDWLYEKSRAEKLQAEQLKVELKFLKSQIQPHFFFNTLNNLYALILEKSEKASHVVLKLSQIMQYILYDAKEPRISLMSEINYIQNYIELEKLRYNDNINIDFDICGKIKDINVPPLLFLPFIENCFKHSNTQKEPLHIKINFKISKKNKLHFFVENNFKKHKAKIIKHGIGNKNVKRRLELLFKDNFELKTKIKDNKYGVSLKLQM